MSKKAPSHELPRTSTPDAGKIERILERLSNGESLNRAAVDEGTDRRRFLEWCLKDEELADKYTRARQFCSEAGRDKLIELREKLEGGLLDAASFRALNDSLKWEMSKLHPRIYGDRLELDGGLNLKHDESALITQANAILAKMGV